MFTNDRSATPANPARDEAWDATAFQPGSLGAAWLNGRDQLACREIIRQGSRSFFAASLLLPRRVAEPACVLYAFCRLMDDAVDLEDGRPQGMARMEAVAMLAARLDRVYAGQPLLRPADRALSEVVAQFDIPRALPDALLEGLAWDAEGRRYDTLEELHAYGARVAGAVGVMMALLMGKRAPETLARACDLGMAMQLTNIARDVGEDARAGRLYLPLAWLREAGIDPDDWLAAPVFTPALRGVIARLLAEAERLYRRANPGIASLPLSCRPAIQAARVLYREIGRELARRDLDSLSRRAVVSGGRKLALLPQALAAALRSGGAAAEPVRPEAAFLIEAVAVTRSSEVRAVAWWNLPARSLHVIEIFERLERRQQTRQFGGAA